MDYLIVSAATQHSVYEQCLDKQRRYFSNYFPYMGYVFPEAKSWEAGTKIKPEAIRKAFKHRDTVMWIDADCLFEPRLSAPPGDWDICTAHNIHPRHKLKTSAGFFMVRNTEGGRLFLHVWEQLNGPAKKDHPAMVKAIRQVQNKIRVGDMTHWLKGRHTINALMPGRGCYAG